ncbi:MAG: hypothetical protein WB615_11170 [Candidatus Tumulicola sp.]
MVFFMAARGRFFTAAAKNHQAMVVTGIICGAAVLVLIGIQVSQSGRDNADAARRAEQARAAHEQRLAWQRAHPKEYAARVAAARAAQARVEAQQRLAQARQAAQQRESDRVANLPENKDPCSYANSRISQGWSDYNGSSYQVAFDDAEKGLAVNERCDQSDEKTLNEGFLLSVKGLSEHYLSSGDARTDLHQAETLLEECQNNPNYYGTHTGAVCETQQENDIKATTNWEVYGD